MIILSTHVHDVTEGTFFNEYHPLCRGAIVTNSSPFFGLVSVGGSGAPAVQAAADKVVPPYSVMQFSSKGMQAFRWVTNPSSGALSTAGLAAATGQVTIQLVAESLADSVTPLISSTTTPQGIGFRHFASINPSVSIAGSVVFSAPASGCFLYGVEGVYNTPLSSSSVAFSIFTFAGPATALDDVLIADQSAAEAMSNRKLSWFPQDIRFGRFLRGNQKIVISDDIGGVVTSITGFFSWVTASV